jgi:hypothetical protein
MGQLPPPASRPTPPVRLLLALGLAAATQRALREGSDGVREAICLWSGRALADGTAVISHLIVPIFDSTDRFLTVAPTERALVANYLRQEQLLLFADVHTHPREAFLSQLDRQRPFSVRNGFYAAVVPDFGQHEPLRGWRWYEVTERVWTEINPEERIDEWRE